MASITALKGKILPPSATGEEGVSGVQVDIGNDDPLWRAFAEKDLLDYLVPGYKASSLDLTKGRDKIQQFVKACETFDNASPPAEGAAASEGHRRSRKRRFRNSARRRLARIDWEAFVDGQDWQLTELKIVPALKEAAQAEVRQPSRISANRATFSTRSCGRTAIGGSTTSRRR